jgi:hypothetical protein
MKTYGGIGGIASPFLTSVINRCERSASRLCRFSPGKTASVTHFAGDWLGPREGLNIMERRKNPCWESNPDPKVIQLVAQSLYRLSYPCSQGKRNSNSPKYNLRIGFLPHREQSAFPLKPPIGDV